MAEPPLLTGAVQETDAEPLPGVAVTAVGAPGAVAAAGVVYVADAPEAGLAPFELVATTVNE